MMATPMSPTPTTGGPKVVYCIRHGQSISNEWMERSGNEWGCPNYNDYNGNVRDAPLSKLGLEQARSLTWEQLPSSLSPVNNNNNSNRIQLVVVSPMTRCLETLFHSSWLSVLETTTPAIVLPLATERVYSVSEIGRTKAELQQAFPTEHLDWSNLPEHDPWWYTGTTTMTPTTNHNDEHNKYAATTPNDDDEWRPHDHGQVYAVPGEPMAHFEERMNALRNWLVTQRPEQCILLITHWGVIDHLSGGTLKVANGQMARLEL
jgi:broad specificity phosphatase PhoE